MKKLYISPLIIFEPLEEEDLMITMSHTETTSFTIDEKDEKTDVPAIIGESDAPIIDDGSDF